MKKKNILIISIIIIVLAMIYFIGYKLYLLNKYSTTQFDNEYSDFLDLVKKRDTYTVQNRDNSSNNYLRYDKLKLENIFPKYTLKDSNENIPAEYQLYENNKVVSTVIILKMNPLYKTKIWKEKEQLSIDNILKRHHLTDTLELFEYLSKQYQII